MPKKTPRRPLKAAGKRPARAGTAYPASTMDFSNEWDLTTIPTDAFYRELQRRRAALPRPGRRKPRVCRWCKEEIPTATELRRHQPICEKNPRVARILAEQKARAAKGSPA